MAKVPRRQIDGIFLLDKPLGVTSNLALQTVKRVLQAEKAGHSGNLDPLATGMLPICLGHATKLAVFLLECDKTYRASVRLGISTDTGDAEGRPIRHSDTSQLSRERLEFAAKHFRGPILQTPPMYSALKREGQTLYELARRGQEIAREPREIIIYDLQITDFRADHFEFQVRCSKGTYVRTLAEDWAAAAGQAAHLSGLRRISIGPFDTHAMRTLDDLETAATRSMAEADMQLLPMLAALPDWPRLIISAAEAERFGHGNPVTVTATLAPGRLAVLDPEGNLLGCGEVAPNGQIWPRRWLSVPMNAPRRADKT